MAKQIQLTQSEKEGRNIFIQLFNLLKSGAKIRHAYTNEELGNKGIHRFIITVQEKKNDK